MSLIHWILDIATLLLWVDWRSGRVVALKTGQVSISITNSIRETEKSRFRGLGSLTALCVLLLVRPFIYWTLGSNLEWTPRINLLVLSIPWRADLLGQMFVFSFLSFACTLGILVSWLLLLSGINTDLTETDLVHRFVRFQLGWLAKLPAWLKLLLPLIGPGLAWAAAAPLLQRSQMIPAPKSSTEYWQQAGLFSVAALLIWRWLLFLVFGVHFVNLYVYLGTHPFWNYMSHTATRLLLPLRWLRFGRADLSPVAGAVLVYFVGEFLKHWVLNTFKRLPL